MNIDSLYSLSPLDGRYQTKVSELRQYFSEFALMKYRVFVEIEWFVFLCNQVKLSGLRKLNQKEVDFCRNIFTQFNEQDAIRIKQLEDKYNHDVKAVECFLREKLLKTDLAEFDQFLHFGCTSEDINNLSYALLLKDATQKEIVPNLKKLVEIFREYALRYKQSVMISRTHGQPATPTTVGKEFAVFISRLDRQLNNLSSCKFLGKFNGAVGNFNAHFIAYPNFDWIKISSSFIESLGLKPNLITTQIESHDFMAQLFDVFTRINSILTDLCQDVWLYISFDVFKQKVIESEIGSSTMPHKVNPIDFENAEGNLGLASATFQHLSVKLLKSRMQRDLSDSTAMRSMGSAFGYSLIAYKSIIKGLSKLEVNEQKLTGDLNENWAVLSEAVQTVLRSRKISNAYDILKSFSRGKKITQKEYINFVKKLPMPKKDIEKLEKLRPDTYIGLAERIVDSCIKNSELKAQKLKSRIVKNSAH